MNNKKDKAILTQISTYMNDSFKDINELAEKAGLPKIGTPHFNELCAQYFGGANISKPAPEQSNVEAPNKGKEREELFTRGELFSSGILIRKTGSVGAIGQSFILNTPCHENGFAPDKEAEANASLWAAAPDMYHALMGFVEYLDSDLSEAEGLLLAKAKAALRKAAPYINYQ